MKALLAKQKMINKVVLIPEHRIKPNPYQPRRVFDQEKIEHTCTVALMRMLSAGRLMMLRITPATLTWFI